MDTEPAWTNIIWDQIFKTYIFRVQFNSLGVVFYGFVKVLGFERIKPVFFRFLSSLLVSHPGRVKV